MKDILKVMRFDFLTAAPLASFAMIVIFFLCTSLSLFFSPMICSYITFVAMLFVIPLQGTADKCGFNKLYGILPVKRKNITRARFLYIYLVHFLTEILELLIVVTAKSLRLYRILPNQNSEMMQFVRESFADTLITLIIVFGIFTFFCLMFSYMEMMGQIHGMENEFKIIMITIGVISVIILIFTALYNNDLLPMISLPGLPDSASDMLILGAVLNVVMFGVSILFGEITASKLAKREL